MNIKVIYIYKTLTAAFYSHNPNICILTSVEHNTESEP